MENDRFLTYVVLLSLDNSKKSKWDAFCPDLPACEIKGTTITNALINAYKILTVHLTKLYEKERCVPLPTIMEQIIEQPIYKNTLPRLLKLPSPFYRHSLGM